MTSTRLHAWTVDEYHRMIEAGILDENDRVELLEGQIVEMSPQRPPHSGTVQRIDHYLQPLLKEQAFVRVQLPITLSTSEPEPDVAIVRLDASGYGDRHPNPNDIHLLIEVAYTSFDTDFSEKAPIYSRAGIQDYWILEVNTRQAHILRNPGTTGYTSTIILTPVDTIAPLAFPQLQIPLSELFLP